MSSEDNGATSWRGTYRGFGCRGENRGVPRNFFRGGGEVHIFSSGQRERGSGGGSPLVRGSGGSCNLVQNI